VSRAPRLTLVILVTQEAEIRRIAGRSQPGHIVCETLSGKKVTKNRAGGVTQGEGPEFKPQYQKQKCEVWVIFIFFLVLFCIF
jgi:hypothetical protein